ARGSEARVEVADGTVFRARHAVVCGGADLRTLFPERFAGLVRCKLLMLRTVPQPGACLPRTLASGLTLRRYPSFRICPCWACLETEPVDADVLQRGIHILFVQDADGSVVVGDSHAYAAGDLDEFLDRATEERILTEAGKLVRLANWTIAERWHGIY